MSSEPIQVAAEAWPGSVAARRGGWIDSPRYDLLLFILSPVAGIAMVLAPRGSALAMFVFGSLIGIPHYLSTYAFYFWDDFREARRAHWVAYAAAPLGLFLALTVLMIVGQRGPLMFLLYWWNAFHIARQNCGILSIYRHAAGAATRASKHAANTAILAVSGSFAMWNLQWNPTVLPYLTRVWAPLPRAAWIVTTAVAAAALAVYVVSLLRRSGSLPELAFSAVALLMFTPYVFMRDWNRASFAVLTGHFVQYLALMWLVHHRKFRRVDGSAAQRALARISIDPRAAVAVVLTIGFVALLLPRVAAHIAWRDFYGWLSGVIAFLHYYLDGVFWAFKRPEVRRALGPVLTPRAA